MIHYSEIEAFNRGERECILLLEEYLDQIKSSYHIRKFPDGQGVLIAESKMSINTFNKLYAMEGMDIALGMVLGYPPECVRWFSKLSSEEKKRAPGINAGSYSFKCPIHLLRYAKEYMKTQYGLETKVFSQ